MWGERGTIQTQSTVQVSFFFFKVNIQHLNKKREFESSKKTLNTHHYCL